MSIKRYRFDVTDDKNSWEAAQRLAAEVGWKIEADDAAVDALRRSQPDLRASRATVTRAQFVAALCAAAGAQRVRFYAP